MQILVVLFIIFFISACAAAQQRSVGAEDPELDYSVLLTVDSKRNRYLYEYRTIKRTYTPQRSVKVRVKSVAPDGIYFTIVYDVQCDKKKIDRYLDESLGGELIYTEYYSDDQPPTVGKVVASSACGLNLNGKQLILTGTHATRAIDMSFGRLKDDLIYFYMDAKTLHYTSEPFNGVAFKATGSDFKYHDYDYVIDCSNRSKYAKVYNKVKNELHDTSPDSPNVGEYEIDNVGLSSPIAAASYSICSGDFPIATNQVTTNYNKPQITDQPSLEIRIEAAMEKCLALGFKKDSDEMKRCSLELSK